MEFYIKKRTATCLHTHTHRHTCTHKCLFQMLRVFSFSEGSAASHRRRDKSQPLDSSEDTFRGLRKPTVFTLFPHGNIQQSCLEWHSYTESIRTGPVHRANYFQCCLSNFILCSGGECEMEIPHHIKDRIVLNGFSIIRCSLSILSGGVDEVWGWCCSDIVELIVIKTIWGGEMYSLLNAKLTTVAS